MWKGKEDKWEANEDNHVGNEDNHVCGKGRKTIMWKGHEDNQNLSDFLAICAYFDHMNAAMK